MSNYIVETTKALTINLIFTEASDVALREVFQTCGEISYVRILQGAKGCKGTAYVCFNEAESVDLALKLDKSNALNRTINVERYHTKKLGGGEAKAQREASEPAKGAARRVAGKESAGQSYQKKKKNFIGVKSDKKKVSSTCELETYKEIH